MAKPFLATRAFLLRLKLRLLLFRLRSFVPVETFVLFSSFRDLRALWPVCLAKPCLANLRPLLTDLPPLLTDLRQAANMIANAQTMQFIPCHAS